MKKFFLMSLLGTIVSLAAMAQLPKEGQYYRIVNQNPDKAISTQGRSYGYSVTEDVISNALTASEQGDATMYNQFWKFVGNKFQNALTQRYISSLSISRQGVTSTTGSTVSFKRIEKGYTVTVGAQMHADAANSIVGWNDESNPSNAWKFEAVTIDEAALKAAQDEYKKQQEDKAALMAIVNAADTYAPIVEGYFTSKGCTELKAVYAAMSDADFKTKMTTDALPEQIQTMVLGIKNKWKDEFNPAMSERFRVQSYKVYTRCDDAGTNANSPKWTVRASQMSDRNNPTGIWTDALQLMYVFVESEIPEGTTLKIAGASGSGVIGLFDYQGTELHQGMNILYCGLNNTTQWIMYTCAADYTKPLSSYPEVKIHIEGGEVLGYVKKHISGDEVYNAADEAATNAEYEEVLKNAVALMDSKGKNKAAINFTVKGERGVFEFPVETYRQIWSDNVYHAKNGAYGYKIYKSLNFYDNVLKWEWSNMGWQDRVVTGKADNDLEKISGGGDAFWPTYINNLAPTMQAPDGKNPYSGNSHTGMPGVGAVESSYNAERADFDVWCCGHESGHNNQSTINLPSCTESSNNFFSNVITTQYGYRLGRGWSFQQNFDTYGYGKTVFSQRDISITMRMWYNLWLYYHVAGHNKSFMPKLHKLLRDDLMSFGGEGWYSGKNGGGDRGNATTSWLKFYEKACEAAGEDLTEYFRMWGFLTPTAEAEGDYIEVIDGKYYAYCGDYSSYYVHSEKADIDAAIKRVKDHKWRENLEVMFIEDRQLLRQRHDPWAKEGDMKRYNWGDEATAASLKADYGDVGDVLTFIDGSANTSDYKYILSGNHIKLTGTGGAGFIVYDKDGNVAYMSNKLEFDIPAEVAQGGFTLKCINANGTSSVAADKAESASADEKLEILRAAMNLANGYTAMEDATGKQVGLYSTEVITPLKDMVSEANTAIKDKAEDTYMTIAKKLNAEVLRLQTSNLSHGVKTNALYTINSVRQFNGSSRYIASNAEGGVVSSTSRTSARSKWAFVPASDKNDGTYYLQNSNNRQFIGATLNEKNNVAGVTMSDEAPGQKRVFKLESLGMGKFGVRPMDNTYLNIDPNTSNIVMWGSSDEGSQWTITEVETLDEVTDSMFTEMITKSQRVLKDVADVSINKTPYELQASNASAAGYISANYQEEGSHTVDKAVDKSQSTYFQSLRTGNDATEPHHLKIDLGAGVSANRVQFDMLGKMVGSRTYNYPTCIYVYGSSDNKDWTRVGIVSANSYELHSPLLRSASSYRYWRLDVRSTAGDYEDFSENPWFAVTDFKFNKAEQSADVHEAYKSITSVETLVNTLSRVLGEAEGQFGAFYRTPLGDSKAYEALVKAYNNLYDKAAAIDPTVNINGIEADKAGNGSIYDLSGRKVSKPAERGIYIINGKKVMR